MSPVLFFNIFSNFWRFWYHKKAQIFLITCVPLTAEICMFRMEDIDENQGRN